MTRRRYKSDPVPPHPHGPDLAQAAVPRALNLACAVREDGAYDVARITDPLSRDELVALSVVLAAMVNIETSVNELLAWVPNGPQDNTWTEAELRRAHAQRAAGRTDPWTTAGEREYQRRRHNRRKAAA